MTEFLLCVCVCVYIYILQSCRNCNMRVTTHRQRSGICYSWWNSKYLTLEFASSLEGALLENHSVSLMLHKKNFLENELKTCHIGIQNNIFAIKLGMTLFKAGLQVTWTIHFPCSVLELLSFFINFGWQYLKWNSSKSISCSLCW